MVWYSAFARAASTTAARTAERSVENMTDGDEKRASLSERVETGRDEDCGEEGRAALRTRPQNRARAFCVTQSRTAAQARSQAGVATATIPPPPGTSLRIFTAVLDAEDHACGPGLAKMDPDTPPSRKRRTWRHIGIAEPYVRGRVRNESHST